MEEEFPFVADQRAWERSLVVVAGTPVMAHDAATEVILAPSLTEGVGIKSRRRR